jgi:hypothetical protein
VARIGDNAQLVVSQQIGRCYRPKIVGNRKVFDEFGAAADSIGGIGQCVLDFERSTDGGERHPNLMASPYLVASLRDSRRA